MMMYADTKCKCTNSLRCPTCQCIHLKACLVIFTKHAVKHLQDCAMVKFLMLRIDCKILFTIANSKTSAFAGIKKYFTHNMIFDINKHAKFKYKFQTQLVRTITHQISSINIIKHLQSDYR